MKVVAFDRSPFKLFTLRFSNKLVLAPFCKRPKTTQRTLFLSFEINNCLPIINGISLDAYEKIRENYMPPVVNSLPILPISLGIVALYEKIYDGEPIFTVFSKHRGGCTIPYFSEVYDVKSVSQPDTLYTI